MRARPIPASPHPRARASPRASVSWWCIDKMVSTEVRPLDRRSLHPDVRSARARRASRPARAHPRGRRQPHTKDGGRGFSALRGLEWCTAFSNPRPSCPGPHPRARARVWRAPRSADRGGGKIAPSEAPRHLHASIDLRATRRRSARSGSGSGGISGGGARAAARECLQPGDRLGIGFAPGELGGSRWWSMCRGRKQPTTTAHLGAVASRL